MHSAVTNVTKRTKQESVYSVIDIGLRTINHVHGIIQCSQKHEITINMYSAITNTAKNTKQ